MAEPLVDAVKLDATSRAASTSASQAAKVLSAYYTKAEKARKGGEKRVVKLFEGQPGPGAAGETPAPRLAGREGYGGSRRRPSAQRTERAA